MTKLTLKMVRSAVDVLNDQQTSKVAMKRRTGVRGLDVTWGRAVCSHGLQLISQNVITALSTYCFLCKNVCDYIKMLHNFILPEKRSFIITARLVDLRYWKCVWWQLERSGAPLWNNNVANRRDQRQTVGWQVRGQLLLSTDTDMLRSCTPGVTVLPDIPQWCTNAAPPVIISKHMRNILAVEYVA